MLEGNLLIRIGMGLLFIWGGLEKFFEGLMGGVGLQKMAEALQSIGFGFLGDTGNLILAGFLALAELIAGIAILANRRLFEAYGAMAIVMLVALVLVHIPSGSWMNSMIHGALTLTLAGLASNHKSKA